MAQGCAEKMPADPALFDGLAISKEADLCERHMGKYPVVFVTLKGRTESKSAGGDESDGDRSGEKAACDRDGGFRGGHTNRELLCRQDGTDHGIVK